MRYCCSAVCVCISLPSLGVSSLDLGPFNHFEWLFFCALKRAVLFGSDALGYFSSAFGGSVSFNAGLVQPDQGEAPSSQAFCIMASTAAELACSAAARRVHDRRQEHGPGRS